MISVRRGYDAEAVDVMSSVQGDNPPNMHARCRLAEFWAVLDDGKPCGGIVIENGFIHVSSGKPCGLQVRRIVEGYLLTNHQIFTAIKPDNQRAKRLAEGLGFAEIGLVDGFVIYRRFAK